MPTARIILSNLFLDMVCIIAGLAPLLGLMLIKYIKIRFWGPLCRTASKLIRLILQLLWLTQGTQVQLT